MQPVGGFAGHKREVGRGDGKGLEEITRPFLESSLHARSKDLQGESAGAAIRREQPLGDLQVAGEIHGGIGDVPCYLAGAWEGKDRRSLPLVAAEWFRKETGAVGINSDNICPCWAGPCPPRIREVSRTYLN